MQDGLSLTLVGLSVVFAVLTAVAVVVSLLGRLDSRWREREQRELENALVKPPKLDDTTLVLIAATVSTVVVGRHRIRSVRRISRVPQTSGSWAQAGRAALHASHVVPKRNTDP